MIPRDRVAREREQAAHRCRQTKCASSKIRAREKQTRDNVGTDAEFQRAGPDENVNESIANDMKNSKAITANSSPPVDLWNTRVCVRARGSSSPSFPTNYRLTEE